MRGTKVGSPFSLALVQDQSKIGAIRGKLAIVLIFFARESIHRLKFIRQHG